MTETSPPTSEQAFCPQRADIVYRRWRRGYVFAITSVSMTLSSFLVFGGFTGTMAELFLKGLIELVSTMAILYVGAGVIDRSQILSKIGDGMKSRRYERTETIVETPPATARARSRTITETTAPAHRPPEHQIDERGESDIDVDNPRRRR